MFQPASLCLLAVIALCGYVTAESTLKSSPSTPASPADLSASLGSSSLEDEAHFRQAVGSTLGSLGFGGSSSAQGPFQTRPAKQAIRLHRWSIDPFESTNAIGTAKQNSSGVYRWARMRVSGPSGASSYQPPYNALNSVYGITYHGDYNQLANYLQTGGQSGPGGPSLAGKQSQKPTISSRFRNFMNSLFFRRSNKHPAAFAQPLPGGDAGYSYGPSAGSYPGFGSAGVGSPSGGAAEVPSSFGSYPAASGQAQYDFSTLVGAGAPGGGGSKASFGNFGNAGIGSLSSVPTATSFGSPGGSPSFSGSPNSFVGSGGGGSFGASPGFSPSSLGPSSFSPGGVVGSSSGGFSRFGSSAGVGSGATYFPGETSQGPVASSSVYGGDGQAFGKGVEESKSDEDKDAKDDQE
ncbi:hypothetical protein BIW11_13027 [Tropilaelaps mercedesae]|uniref:Uncharacterized protein n=1 Tax=Tropilaelaps mercedesae TaxID=418985 RepID=A0A1V9X3U8_9ACAR|nr:hypothetical protein BIW11_13027 [Tropilaelaps mercedesae]